MYRYHLVDKHEIGVSSRTVYHKMNYTGKQFNSHLKSVVLILERTNELIEIDNVVKYLCKFFHYERPKEEKCFQFNLDEWRNK